MIQAQNNIHMIILIGPICAGKSTIAECLAEKLALPHYSLDDKRWQYYEELGYDRKEATKMRAEQGMMKLIQYWKPFEAHSVERILSDYANGIIDFGGGHSVYKDQRLFARVQKALEPHPYVILLLPSPDLDESTTILNERFSQLLQREVGEVDSDLLQLNAHFVKHPSNHQLAKFTIYTKDKPPQETCTEIIDLFQLNTATF